ncbi:hypothetical protein AAAT68_03595 [Lawsonibacter asaccharolyticus]
MIKDYMIGPSMYPYGCFDIRFAKKYGIEEAIIFNILAHEIILMTQRDESRKYWGGEPGCMEEGGHFWVRFTENFLFHTSTLFTEAKIRQTLRNLESSGLLLVRPSMTKGYFWITLGEERE